jgi:hypothetical protein
MFFEFSKSKQATTIRKIIRNIYWATPWMLLASTAVKAEISDGRFAKQSKIVLNAVGC